MLISPRWSLSVPPKCKLGFYFTPESENQIPFQQGAVGEPGTNVLAMSEFGEVNPELCKEKNNGWGRSEDDPAGIPESQNPRIPFLGQPGPVEGVPAGDTVLHLNVTHTLPLAF